MSRCAINDIAIEILDCLLQGVMTINRSTQIRLRGRHQNGSPNTLATYVTPDYGQSIADLNIHSAMCCPVEVDEAVAACLYLDARGAEASVALDDTGFCEALSRVAGLAIANLRRRELQKRQTRMTEELGAAREAQQFMIPEDVPRGDPHLGIYLMSWPWIQIGLHCSLVT